MIQSQRRSRRGGALLIAVIAVVVLAGMTAAMLTVSSASQRENLAASDRVQALYVAEAGLSKAIADFDPTANKLGMAYGGKTTPAAFGGGGYWFTVSPPNPDNSRTISAFGTAAGASRGVAVQMEPGLSPIYSNALFAGNSSNDSSYSLDFGGCASQADYIDGPVYSGNDINVDCNAKITGAVRASGTITGITGGAEGITQPVPDIPSMNYAVNHDVDVAAEFAASASYKSNPLGGSAEMLSESNPAHIFVKNPSDRSSEWSGTSKDDYFLEDPYEPANTSSVIDPTGGAHITLSGLGGKPGPNGNELVYYIDGNLWVHNTKMFSFTLFNQGSEGVKVTLVVKGNIYISDNIFYDDPVNSGLALIAINDAKEPDSGNIYFGDPKYGTLEQMEAFMFAENDFYDNNLSATGSKTVTVNGNMTAGNQVNIMRDYNNQHSKLTVNFDDRIMTKKLTLPGLPSTSNDPDTWQPKHWHEIPVP